MKRRKLQLLKEAADQISEELTNAQVSLPNTGGAFGSTSTAKALVRVDLWFPTLPGHSDKWGTNSLSSIDCNDPRGYTKSIDMYSYEYVCTDIILGTNWSMPDPGSYTNEDVAIAHEFRPRGAVLTIKCGGTLSQQKNFGVGCVPAGVAVTCDHTYPVLMVAREDVVVPVGRSSIRIVFTGGVGGFKQDKSFVVEPTSMHPEIDTGVSGLQKEGPTISVVKFQPSLFQQPLS